MIKRKHMGAEGAELDGTGSELTKRCVLVGLYIYIYACVYRERESYNLDNRTIDNRIAHWAQWVLCIDNRTIDSRTMAAPSRNRISFRTTNGRTIDDCSRTSGALRVVNCGSDNPCTRWFAKYIVGLRKPASMSPHNHAPAIPGVRGLHRFRDGFPRDEAPSSS